MKKITFLLLFWCYSQSSIAQSGNIYVETTNNQMKLKVNGKDFMINGMNWDYFPIGTNYNYSLWKQSDDVIKAALDTEMSLLRNMGVNAIRQYTGVPPKWIQYIYEKYGIYTMLNHSFGRYGLNVNGKWIPNTEYADPSTEALLLAESTAMVTEYQNTPGILLFLLGNENNYGLFWGGAETEDIPVKDRKSTARAQAMYKVFNKAVLAMKAIDKTHPMAICNGDLLFIELIAKECKDIDILGVNMYRGATFTDAFETVKKELNKPLLFTEFGADAFNAMENQEDQKSQAYYNVENWKDIYSNAAGMGKAGNSLGGFTFQFSDGWWKFGQTVGLDVHDNNASWSNGGYPLDLVLGENNMNEEWFGICAKGPTNNRGLYDLYPRAAYYALQEVHKINPFELGATLETIKKSFDAINMMDAVLRARGDKAAMGGSSNDILKISNLRAEFTTFNTGGTLLTTPETADPDNQIYPNKTGFDHMESYFVGVEGNPAPNMKANVNVNILGRVAENPINEIFYENRGRLQTVDTPNGPLVVNDFNRVQVYNASYTWNAKDFDIRGFYRTGHYHWGYEGDFFALYPETNYGPNLDIYNGETSGMEFDGKGILKGFKAAFGPQLWWGANPAFLLKYGKKVGSFNLTGVYHRDLNTNIRYDENGNRILNQNQVRSGVIPPWVTERATIAIQRQFGDFGVVLGGIWGGNPLNGVSFLVSEDGVVNANNRISGRDNWGGKAKITFSSGRFNVYTQGAIMGLVAGGGADNTQTFTGWQLKDSGSGNQTNFLTGFTYNVNANLQIAPNFLWQKPIIDAIPNDFSGAGRLRNILDDPFVVRANRETVGGELLLTWDPTPATWMYEWDNDMNEDALFALSTGFVYRHLPTTQDAAIGFQADRSFLRFPRSAPAQDLWESNTRIVSKVSPDLGLIANIYFGNGQANGDSERTINRAGGDLRVVYQKVKLTSSLKFNDWGPFDYHRDFNITFPVQTSVDLSTSIGKQNWFILPNTKIGIMGIWRSMDQNSGGRYAPNAVLPDTFPAVPTISPVGFGNGSEWEIRTYIHINIGK
jgi:hypothetical protein